MAGRVTVLTPVNHSDAIELGRSTWRKQILPIGSLDYSGRKLHFTREYLDNLVAAFKDRAFDACPLQLADASNSHTNEPDRAAGEVVGLESTDDGLYATVSATDKGSEILREHPNLGVSVRIVEDYQRQTGQGSKAYPAALQHVLCTWAPRIASMKPWEPITCSEETDEVLDLSALTFTTDGTAVVSNPEVANIGETDTADGGEPEEPVATLTDEQIGKLLKLIEGGGTDSVAEDNTPDGETEAPADVTAEAEAGGDAEVERAVAAATGDGEGSTVDLALVELRTTADRQAIELAEIKAE
ncbi:MAG TPA: hypothetical protein VNH17_16930, partial [Streptosporangiaceae bacterium]|nr:hypothetical protein [Streptosporangiaceae bacterium]